MRSLLLMMRRLLSSKSPTLILSSMILSINQFLRDYDESPELKCVCLDVCDPVSGEPQTVMTSEEYAMFHGDE